MCSRLFRPGECPPKVAYSLVRELADDGIPVAVACGVLDVSTSGFYDWLGRPESPRELRNEELTKMIREIHEDSRGSYGVVINLYSGLVLLR